MGKKKGKEEHHLMREGNISLILDGYDDIFSDFDPRHYSERAVSDDFLAECKKATHDSKNHEQIEMRLLIPSKKRRKSCESIIKKRLRQHFLKHYHEKLKEVKELKREGILWIAVGVCLIFFATLLRDFKSFIYSFLIVLFEPAGWFTVWTGFEKVFIEKVKDYEFYERMATVSITFHSY